MRIPSIRLLSTALFALCLTLPAAAQDWLYLTYPGDTLIGIGKQYLKNPNDWPKVQITNKVSDPRKLPANTRIRIPVDLLKVTPAPAVVTAVTGNVRVRQGEAPFQPLAANSQLTGGELVLTGPRSSATYRFADGTTLTQQASSRLKFGRLAAYGKTGMVATEVELEQGRIEASAAAQQAPAGGFRVATPVAVAGLRGTAFRLNLAEDGKTLRSEVLEGAVGIAAQGVEVRVADGQGTVTELGRPPAPPRALLPRPDLRALPGRVTRLPLAFAWPQLDGASAWRAQIAAEPAFHAILLEGEFAEPEAHWHGTGQDDASDEPALPDGNYHLRVRAIAADGLEGWHTDHAFTLAARPLPPPALSPCLGERLLGPDAEFAWAAAAGAHGYLLQIAPTPAFDEGLREHRLPAVTRHVERLSEGDWHWRLASIDARGEARAFGPHRAFRVQPPPQAPAAREARAEHGHVRLAWGPSRGAQRYQVEIARDADFAQTLHDLTVDTTGTTVALVPGRYHWRVRGIEDGGLAGVWSPAASVIQPPPPPVVVAPVEDASLRVAETTLRWSPAAGALAYQVQIAATPDFAQPVLDQRVADTALATRVERPGAWHWRVAALGEDDASLGYGAPGSWWFAPPPAPPGQPAVTEDGGVLHVTWPGTTPGFRLEIARDPAFTDLYGRHDVNRAEARVLRPPPGHYWLRVIALEADGTASPPGEALALTIRPFAPWWLLPFLLLVP